MLVRKVMASKARLTPSKEDVPEKGGSATPPGQPLLDLKDPVIERLIRSGSKCGYITQDQISALSKALELALARGHRSQAQAEGCRTANVARSLPASTADLSLTDLENSTCW